MTDPIARPIGTMMLILMGLAVASHATRQSNITMSLIVGIIFAVNI